MQGLHAGALCTSLGDTRSGRYAIRVRDVTQCCARRLLPRVAGCLFFRVLNCPIPVTANTGEHMSHCVIVS